MNKATSVQSFTYLGLVVSEKNIPKKLTITLWGYGLQSPLKIIDFFGRKSPKHKSSETDFKEPQALRHSNSLVPT